MRRGHFVLLSALLIALAFVNVAEASHVIVPTDVPTVQAGLDSKADTVYVKTGDFDGEVVMRRFVVLLDAPSEYLVGPGEVPRIGRLTLDGTEGGLHFPGAVIRGIWFKGPVRVLSGNDTFLSIESCRFDSGLVQIGTVFVGGEVDVRSCLVFGDLHLVHNASNVIMCTVIGGGIRVASLGYHTIIGNYVRGAPGIGIFSSNSAYPGYVEDNTVVDCGTGLSSSTGGLFEGNTVIHCSGDGVLDTQDGEDGLVLTLGNNRITDCGGHGMNVGSGAPTSVVRNRIERCGADGIHCIEGSLWISENVVIDAGHDGIAGELHENLDIEGNRVYHAAADGIRVNGRVILTGNIVGRCGGDGISITKPRERIHHNTSYRNQGSGIFLVNSVEGGLAVDHNIGFGNGRHGIDGLAMIQPSCNDWFSNQLDPLTWPTSADLQLDPLFCDVETDSVGLRPESPLVAAKGCDLIGALGVTCGDPASAPASHAATNAPSLSIRLESSPLRALIGLVDDSPARLDVFDIQGRVVASREVRALAAGEHEIELASPLRPGVYFARLTQSRYAVTSKAVVLHTR